MLNLLIFLINTMTYVKSLPGEKEGSQGKTAAPSNPFGSPINVRGKAGRNTARDFQGEMYKHMGRYIRTLSVLRYACNKVLATILKKAGLFPI